ncbi:hypothetical protein HS125_12055 [bacterium]|nr:hypothetical protein [bacterium]
MKYLKTTQIVPGKGYAWLYYELEDDYTIRRYVQHLPETGEATRNEKPPRMKLFRPQLATESSSEEFEKYWALGA